VLIGHGHVRAGRAQFLRKTQTNFISFKNELPKHRAVKIETASLPENVVASKPERSVALNLKSALTFFERDRFKIITMRCP
jgi:hypothetical protein